jgi:hypothetical protein
MEPIPTTRSGTSLRRRALTPSPRASATSVLKTFFRYHSIRVEGHHDPSIVLIHSISSSARAMMEGGMLRPSSPAVQEGHSLSRLSEFCRCSPPRSAKAASYLPRRTCMTCRGNQRVSTSSHHLPRPAPHFVTLPINSVTPGDEDCMMNCGSPFLSRPEVRSSNALSALCPDCR